MVKVTVNGICREYENGVTYEKLAQEHQAEYDHRIILAIANGKIKELHKTVDRDAAVTFQTLADRVGHDTYIRSASCFLSRPSVISPAPPGRARFPWNFPSAGAITAFPGENWLKR